MCKQNSSKSRGGYEVLMQIVQRAMLPSSSISFIVELTCGLWESISSKRKKRELIENEFLLTEW